jgi:hypothetical protein
MKRFLTTALILSFAAAAVSVGAQAARCDRACLDKTVDNDIAALAAHDPSQVSFATDVKFVENTIPMKPGERLWKTAAKGHTTFKIYVPDPVAPAGGFNGRDEGRRQDHPRGPALEVEGRQDHGGGTPYRT